MQEGHMQESAPKGVADGIPAAAQGAPRVPVKPFLSEMVSLPNPHYPDRSVKASVWVSRDDRFAVQVDGQLTATVWTTAEGIRALVRVCEQALGVVRL